MKFRHYVSFTLLVGFLFSIQATAVAEVFYLPPPDVDVVGRLRQTKTSKDDTFVDIARRYNLGFREIILANPGIDPWIPGEGTEILLPTRYILPDVPRTDIVLNVSEMRLYYFPTPKKGERPILITYPVSIGRVDWKTPLGLTSIVKKQKAPSWYPPASIKKEHLEKGDPLPDRVPPGPDNPLGDFAMRLGIPGYLIHGTNKPSGIGMQVTHGCIRMFPEDIEKLFGFVAVGTKVNIIDQPYKAGWHKDTLFLEVHPPIIDGRQITPKDLTPVVRLLLDATQKKPTYKVDWQRARSVLEDPLGIPIPIPVPLPTPLAEAVEPIPHPQSSTSEAQREMASMETDRLAVMTAPRLEHLIHPVD